jgi:ligand-binding sensor domain-containing protein
LIITILLFSFYSALSGQDSHVQIVSVEKNFGKSSILTMMEDHQGIIWAATQLGLLRFDGIQTTTYMPEKDNPNSISNEYVYDLFEDNYHFIWIATRNGLTRIDPSRKIFTRYKNNTKDPGSIPNNRIFGIVPDSDSTFLLLCDRSGLSSFNIRTGRSTRLNPMLKSSDSTPTIIWATRAFLTPSGNLLIGTFRNLYSYDKKLNELYQIHDAKTGYDLVQQKKAHFTSRDSTIWFTAENDILYKWIPGETLIAFQDTSLRRHLHAGVIRMQDYNKTFLLASTSKDYLLVNKQTGQFHPLRFREDVFELFHPMQFQPDQINYSLETKEGIVVMGSHKGDLFMINPLLQQFHFKKISGHNPYANVQMHTLIGDVFEDDEYQKRYITVLQDSFFYVEDLMTGQVKAYNKELYSAINSKWMLDHAGRLWLCSGNSVLAVDRIRHTIRKYDPDSTTKNLFMMVEVSPGRMLVGSFAEGLFWFEPDKSIFQKIPIKRGLIRTQVYSMKMDKVQQCVWIGTVRNGLLRYDIQQDSFVHFLYDSRNPHSIGGDWVRDIAIDSTGDVWFSTDPIGLSRYDYQANPDSAFFNYSVDEGLPTNFIAGLGVDRTGYIWMTSLNGIARLDPHTFRITHYGIEDGLAASRFLRAYLSMTHDGTILVGAEKGYIHFHPDSLESNQKPPELIIRDFLVFDTSMLLSEPESLDRTLQLTYKQNYFTIVFSIVNFTDAEQNSVRYKMEGLEDHWNTRSGIHEVSYTNVPPGDYTFRILASNNDGVWNENETRIQIYIQPPFWQRTWFYILLGAIVTGIVVSLYNYRLRQSVKQRALMVEKETMRAEAEMKMAQLEMSALRAQMNPHFIFNCLNSINRFIIVNDNDTASEYLTKFSKLIRQVLDNSRGEKTLLITEIETLTLYIEMESLRFADKFEYEMIVAPELLSDAYLIQPMLIQPYVENAIWHGLMHNKGKGKLSLTFSRKEDALMVSIQDNGVGREMAKKIKESQLIQRKSHGMKVTAERMSLLSKKLNVTVQAEVFDVYNEEQHIAGTRVVLTLPIEQ